MNSHEELDEKKDKRLSREDIEQRVEDWVSRIENLYGLVKQWAKENDWKVQDLSRVPMNEELMQAFGIPARMLPTLKVETSDGHYALLKPKALWVIGANGRIDLYTSKGAFIIVDQAERLKLPDWRIFRADDKQVGQIFDPALLLELA